MEDVVGRTQRSLHYSNWDHVFMLASWQLQLILTTHRVKVGAGADRSGPHAGRVRGSSQTSRHISLSPQGAWCIVNQWMNVVIAHSAVKAKLALCGRISVNMAPSGGQEQHYTKLTPICTGITENKKGTALVRKAWFCLNTSALCLK